MPEPTPIGVAATQPPEPKEPRDHVLRELLPWRDIGLTECGRPANDVASTITRDELAARIKKHGQQRTAFTVCMTCYHTSERVDRVGQWQIRPTEVLSREIKHHDIVYTEYQKSPNGYLPTGWLVDQLSVELHAIAELIAEHRDEFDQRVTAASDAALFTARRRAAQRKR